MTVQFPQRRSDGSFDVIVRIGGVAAEGPAVQRWISSWAERRSSWERLWEGADRNVEILKLADDFHGPPTLEALEGGELTLRLRARPNAKMWKDWMVRFVEDFCTGHPGASLLKFESG